MRLDLMPCPVCSGEAEMTTTQDGYDFCETFCKNCGIRITADEVGLDCGKKWNALPRTKSDLVDELSYRRAECAKLAHQMGRAWTAVFVLGAAFLFIGGAVIMNLVMHYWVKK